MDHPAEGWKAKLARELKAAQFEFDADKVLVMNQLVPITSTTLPVLAAAGEHAGMRFLEFLRGQHPRRAHTPRPMLERAAANGEPRLDPDNAAL